MYAGGLPHAGQDTDLTDGHPHPQHQLAGGIQPRLPNAPPPPYPDLCWGGAAGVIPPLPNGPRETVCTGFLLVTVQH
jgi:hypothetical protein